FTVSTYDYTNSQAVEQAKRNYGIRAWDKEVQKMKFWEFDVFGGITTGEIKVEGNQIYYIYAYQSKSGATLFLADIWSYADANTYTFQVCEYAEGKLGKEYLSTVYRRK
ncbi:MAG TPA: hypothetical protein DCM08_05030, partial [Microscillaceae bacterium]|nr:hypothetical protein [Microscillaceae bacterium]